ncbi:MAG: hypothetical protein GX907_03075 [Clostridiaceae bacterium]|nr:hypothetical protein [Clostridiaceae bacterium]
MSRQLSKQKNQQRNRQLNRQRSRQANNMNVYLSHWSAIRYYQVPQVDVFFPVEAMCNDVLHTTVYSYRARFNKKGIKSHYCKLDIPDKYLRYDPANDLHVVAPELAYMQLANYLDRQKLILLGILLAAKPVGSTAAPITTKKKMLECAQQLVGHRGRRAALQALQYVEDNCSADSAVEAVAFMILSLPNDLGGLNIRDLKMNVRFSLNAREREAFGENGYYVDFCSRFSRLAIDYDSEMYHSRDDLDPELRAKADREQVRRTVIAARGYEVMSLRTNQLYNPLYFEYFVREMFRRAKLRLRIRAKRFWGMLWRLHSLLPRAGIPKEIGGDPDRLARYKEAIERHEARDAKVRANFLGGHVFWRLKRWLWDRSMEVRRNILNPAWWWKEWGRRIGSQRAPNQIRTPV